MNANNINSPCVICITFVPCISFILLFVAIHFWHSVWLQSSSTAGIVCYHSNARLLSALCLNRCKSMHFCMQGSIHYWAKFGRKRLSFLAYEGASCVQRLKKWPQFGPSLAVLRQPAITGPKLSHVICTHISFRKFWRYWIGSRNYKNGKVML